MTDADPTRALPPRPDPETGLPRPPHAPNFIGNRLPAEQDRDRDTRLSAKPNPPEGQAPVLAWYRSSRRGALVSGIVGVLLILVALFLIKGFETRVFGYWWVWAVAVAAGVGIYFSIKASWCSAGADWFSFQKSWVKTYELTDIKTRFYSNTIYVYLTDADGRKLDAQLNIIQMDRLIWDLLYNGIRHSIANGATLSGTAHNYFSSGLRAQPETEARSLNDRPERDVNSGDDRP